MLHLPVGTTSLVLCASLNICSRFFSLTYISSLKTSKRSIFFKLHLRPSCEYFVLVQSPIKSGEKLMLKFNWLTFFAWIFIKKKIKKFIWLYLYDDSLHYFPSPITIFSKISPIPIFSLKIPTHFFKFILRFFEKQNATKNQNGHIAKFSVTHPFLEL